MSSIVLTRRLPHPVERVWRAVSDPAELAAWMPGGGGFPDPVVCEPPRVIAWEAAGQTFRIELAPDADGTLLRFEHGSPPDPRDQFAEGWETYLTRLDALLAGDELGEQEAHDQRRLTLGAGPELRLERRFFVSAERLWHALTETDELRHWFPDDMEVLESDPPRRLVARWKEGTTLTFELEAEGPATRLTFVHGFSDPDQAALAAAGWDRCFVRLEALLGGAPMSREESLELWDFVHARYVERFAT